VSDRDERGRVRQQWRVAPVRRRDTSTAPIVAADRIVTLRARTLTVPVSVGTVNLWYVHARPTLVEVIDANGGHATKRIPDITFATRVAALALPFVCAVFTRRQRRRARSTT
jgi:hypothetical protein